MLEASSQLSNTYVYDKCKRDPLRKVNIEMKSVLRDMFSRKDIN